METTTASKLSHVTRDSDTTRVERSRSPGHFTQRSLNT